MPDQVTLPGEECYDNARAGWNLLVEHHPAAIVEPDTADDVAAAVNFARSAGLPVAVQATGHGPSVPADGALLINTRRMTELTIDVPAATARIGPGATWEPLIEAGGHHGLAPLVGSSPGVSVAGYITGGGLPVLGREFGFAADHVSAIELVTADGQLRRSTANEHQDLFWAVRGGKGNFGVVTAIETGLVPVDRLYAGTLSYPGEAAQRVLSGWLTWTSALPEEMSSSATILRVPDIDSVPPQMRGIFLTNLQVAYTGSIAEGERLLQPLRAMKPLKDSVADIPYSRIAEVYGDPTEPTPVRDRGILLRDLDEEAIRRLAAIVTSSDERPPFIARLRLLGGALSRAADPPNAVGHRDGKFCLVLGFVTPPERVQQADRIAQAMIDRLEPWANGHVLPSFLGSGETRQDTVRAAYRDADWQTLTKVKAKYDPDNLFRINHNIPPASSP